MIWWWSAGRPGHTLPPGKTRYPFYRRLGGPHGRSGRAENLVPTGIRSRTVQPLVSRYTAWATRPTDFLIKWTEMWRRKFGFKVTHHRNSLFILRSLIAICWNGGCHVSSGPRDGVEKRKWMSALKYILYSPKRPHRLWCPFSLLFNG
jgi:hypothetical protein